jgi:pimeloyl-ACP methyl ester carboxylesterase
LIEQAEKGNFSAFLALRDASEASAEKWAMGMFYSVICSEDAFQIQPDAIEREAAGTFFGPELAEMRLKPCEFWPRAEIDPSYFAKTPSDIPALILSGELDPLTPPSWGEQVASYWRNLRHVVIPGTAHRTIVAGGVLNLIRAFLDKGSAADLDVSFTQHLKRPPFFISPSGPKTVAAIEK